MYLINNITYNFIGPNYCDVLRCEIKLRQDFQRVCIMAHYGDLQNVITVTTLQLNN